MDRPSKQGLMGISMVGECGWLLLITGGELRMVAVGCGW